MSKSRNRLPAEAFEYDEARDEEQGMTRSGDRGAGQEDERVGRIMDPALIKNEMLALIKQGGLPKGFDPNEAMKDQEFIELAVQMPVKYAVLVYEARVRAKNAEQEAMMKLAERLRSRKELPQAERAGASGAPAWDYENMPPELFRKLEEHLKSQARKGIRIKL